MKAIVYNKYGNTNRLKYIDIPKPELDDDSVLVKVFAAGINAMDIHVLNGKPFLLRLITGLFKPKIKVLGSDVSGVVESAGKNVTKFKVGDEVFGQLPINKDGSYAEYVLISPKQLARKPIEVSHSESASVGIAGMTALQALKLAEVTDGKKVLVYGASGGVGTFVIQIAKALKAKVTAVCSTRNIDVAKNSGADIIVDYKKEKWYEKNEKYDAIIGVNGYTSLKKYRDALNDEGIFVMIGGEMKQMVEMYLLKPFMRKKGNKKFLGFVTKGSTTDLNTLADLLEKKELKPYIDQEFSLSDAKEALDHFAQGKTIGKTVIKVI